MVKYEFYWRDDIRGYELVKTVSERRRDRERITRESLQNLAKKVFGEEADFSRICFIRVETEDGKKSTWPNPWLAASAEQR